MFTTKAQPVVRPPAPKPKAKPRHSIVWEVYLVYEDGHRKNALTIREPWSYGQLFLEVFEKRRGNWMAIMGGKTPKTRWEFITVEHSSGEIIRFCRDCIFSERPHIHHDCKAMPALTSPSREVSDD